MLGEKIRNLRKENKISQEALAEKLGVSRQSISLWENDQTMPSMENIISIANIFGVSTDTLLKENSENAIDEKITETTKPKNPLKKKLFVILSIILALAIIGVSAFVVVDKFANRKLSAEEIFNLIAPSTVEINAIGDTFESTGTGSFIDNNGTVVTNYHVIESCHTINIKTQDGKTYNVESVLGFDKDRDLAIIKADCQNESFITLKTDGVKTGENVYTLGSSLGLTGTFSEGIISSASREIGGFDFIQTTAPISSGNSGGPLVDEYGKVIGITTGAFTEGQNLNLAIPSKAVAQLFHNLDDTKTMSIEQFYESQIPEYTVQYVVNHCEDLLEETFFVDCWASTFEFYPSYMGWIYCANSASKVHYPKMNNQDDAYEYDRIRSMKNEVVRANYRYEIYGFTQLRPPHLSLGDHIRLLCVGLEEPIYLNGEAISPYELIVSKIEVVD